LILRAAQRLEVSPERSVVLEDAPAGIAAGKAAGSRVIAIAATFPLESLREADLIVRSFHEVTWSREQWEEFLIGPVENRR
jgi:sugar-phosphatase